MENNNVSSEVKEASVENDLKVGKVQNNSSESKKSMIFVTEEDTFEASVEFYEDNKKLFVKGIDDIDETKKTEKISLTIKYPSQADVEYIASGFRSFVNGQEKTTISDIIKLETIRFMVLARKWSLAEELNNDSIMKLNPKIVKAILFDIRSKIEMDGII